MWLPGKYYFPGNETFQEMWISRKYDFPGDITSLPPFLLLLWPIDGPLFMRTLSDSSKSIGCLSYVSQHMLLMCEEGSRISWRFTFPGKSHFPGSNIFLEATFPRMSHFPGSHISRKINFPGKLHLTGIHIFHEVIFPGSHISREDTFPGKSNFPGSQTFPGSHISREVMRYHWCNLK